MILIIDHYDSFSYNLRQLFEVWKSVEVIRCDQLSLDEIEKCTPEMIVLSPGPGRPEDTGITLPLLADRRFDRTPLLGVCLGFQAMATHWGGEVLQADEIVHGKTLELTLKKHSMTEELSQPFKAARYHSLAVRSESLPQHIELISEHEGMAMWVLDQNMPRCGVQFHPESFLTPEGKVMTKKILENFQVI